MDSLVVQVRDGKLRGTERAIQNGEKILAFQGIPYGKPPVGQLRFKAPEPVDPWEGVKDATADGSCCYHRDGFLDSEKGSEDCLFLNVFTKSVTAQTLQPVMVFIHGGGFLSGSNDINMYNPDFLLQEDIVLVTINYRLGILGFLSLDDPTLNVPGNAAMKDQVLALRWVQRNISTFSGDPKNVTIFGESAGAAAVHYLVLSPSAKGLFHKAIIQSGCVLNPWAHGSKSITKALQGTGKSPKDDKESLDFLSKLSVEDLCELQNSILTAKGSFMKFFAPVVEYPNPTAFLTKDPYEMLKAGEYNKVPLMMGYNDKEGVMFEIESLKSLIGVRQGGKAELSMMLSTSLGLERDCAMLEDLKEKIEKLYFKTDDMSSRVDFTSAFYFIDGLRYSAELHVATSSEPIYFYRFSADTRLNLTRTITDIIYQGACHADDLSYLFKCSPASIEQSSIEETVINMVVRLWTNFAKTSNPTPTESTVGITWKPVRNRTFHCLDIGTRLYLMDTIESDERFAFWKYFHQVFFEAGQRYSCGSM